MARRTRRPTVAWLPSFPSIFAGFQPDGNFLQFVLDPPGFSGAGNDGVTAVNAITTDAPPEAANEGNTRMAVYEGGGYRLRRIVGKCFAAMDQPTGIGRPEALLVTAGFIVLRVDPFTGDPLRAATANDYSPQLFGSERDPWIWRRTWLLGNNATPTTSNGVETFPRNNAEYGSVADGPHIDQKTARTVKTEERLFFVASAVSLGTAFATPLAGRAVVTLDYRLLGSPMKVMGNRGNASR